MAITLEANYLKKLGLPGFSSHAYSLTVRSEVVDIHQIPDESERLYQLLQSAVDREIRNCGWLPNGSDQASSNGSAGGDASNGNWKCSEKQQDLILKIVNEHQLPKEEVNELALERFDKGVRDLNRMEASGLIDELFSRYSNTRKDRSRKSHAFQRNGNHTGRRAS